MRPQGERKVQGVFPRVTCLAGEYTSALLHPSPTTPGMGTIWAESQSKPAGKRGKLKLSSPMAVLIIQGPRSR